MDKPNRFCRKCRKPYYDSAGSTEFYCLCPACTQAKLHKAVGRSASPYPHGVTVRWLDSRQLAIRN